MEIFKGDTIKGSNIHNLANYYNYGYTKTTYKYYVKIDADQIYFTKKMMKIKKMICSEWINWLREHRILPRILNKISKMFHINISFQLDKSSALIFLLVNEDLNCVLGGVNLFTDKGEFVIPIKSSIAWSSFFNGMGGDTLIWTPKSSSYYLFDEENMYEYIPLPSPCHQIGVCWIHLSPIKSKILIPEEVTKTLPLLELSKMTWGELYNPLFDNLLRPNDEWSHKHFKMAGEKFWDKDRKYITQNFYNKNFPSILEYYKKNIMNK